MQLGNSVRTTSERKPVAPANPVNSWEILFSDLELEKEIGRGGIISMFA